MTEKDAYIAFNLLPDVGAVTVRQLVARHGSAVAAWEAYPDKRDFEGRVPQWERELERAAKQNVQFVTLLDESYPALLREIASPPLVLYVVGDPAALNRPGIALVGTRRPSLYGTETARRFALELVHAQWAVYSGLALGIDTAAHRGALEGQGITVGVLGGALDRFYPKDNTRLAREIVAHGGAVATEFPFGRPPDMKTFPQRNRIVSGLSRGVVAVEAPLQSGTLITCRLAGEQGRAVMAVPGRVDQPNSRGCLHLIREGATLVANVDDILEAVSPMAALTRPARPRVSNRPTAPVKPPAKKETAPAVGAVSLEESLVLRELKDTALTIDALARAAKLPVGKVNALLVQLRLKRLARFLPGNRVMRAAGPA